MEPVTSTVGPGSNDLGIILTGATTSEALFQPYAEAERGATREGMLVLVKMRSPRAHILARISEIIPHNAFYAEGDGFTEARRRRMAVPAEVARQYETCRLELLTLIPRSEITIPPHPGDTVALYDPTQNEREIFGKGRGDAGIIWYGSLNGYAGAPIPLNIEKTPEHVAVFGVTGSGKSYDMGSLIEAMASIPATAGDGSRRSLAYPMVIIDANGDYTDYAGWTDGTYGAITRFVFPNVYDHMRRTGAPLQNISPIGVSLDDVSSRDLAETIIQFYKGGSTEGAELQVNALHEALQQFEQHGLSHQLLLTTSYNDLRGQIPGHQQTIPAVQRALDKFRSRIEEEQHLLTHDSPLKDKRTFLENLTRSANIAILDFSADGATGVDLPTKQLVISYLSTIFYDQFTQFKMEGAARYMMFVLEEAQNFCPGPSYPVGSSLAKTKLSAIATQGRKFGLSLCLISQRPSFVDRIVLSMCNTFLIHRVSPEDVRFVGDVSGGLPKSVVKRLTNLERGEMVVAGQMSLVPFPLLIRGPAQRAVNHSAGRTDVIQGLLNTMGLSDGSEN